MHARINHRLRPTHPEHRLAFHPELSRNTPKTAPLFRLAQADARLTIRENESPSVRSDNLLPAQEVQKTLRSVRERLVKPENKIDFPEGTKQAALSALADLRKKVLA